MEQSTTRQPHRLVLENRKKSMISGVQDVQSFHEQEILLLTEEGKLQIKGEGLHVKRLNLEKGEADIEGRNRCRAAVVLQGSGDFSLDVSGAGICGVF